MGISDDKQGDCFRLDVNQVEVSFGGTRVALLSDPPSIASWTPILRRSFSWYRLYPSTGGGSPLRVRTSVRVLYCDDDHRILQWNDDPMSISIFKRTADL